MEQILIDIAVNIISNIVAVLILRHLEQRNKISR
jgi:hypothetical protein